MVLHARLLRMIPSALWDRKGRGLTLQSRTENSAQSG